ncbi:MAG: hypothetical protein KDC00_04835 [Flavobacteriales bacterium]|nr:hypothetical protein [Flavobacteriales bacterium]
MVLRYTVFLLLFAMSGMLRAEHLPGGTITTRCVGGNFHEITLKLFRECSGSPMIPQDLSFSNDCGVNFQQTAMQPVSVEEVSPLCPEELPNSRCNGGTLLGFELYTYRTTIFLSPCSLWRISWRICCRNQSLNVSGTPGLYLETTLYNLDSRCNDAPEFVDDTVPMVCVGQPVSYDGSATESDGNTLRYRLIDARFGAPTPTPVQYNPPFSGAVPFTGMAIDSLTGRIAFLPTVIGNIVAVIEVREFDSMGNWQSTVMKDFLFIVNACANDVPSVDGGPFMEATGVATITGDHTLRVCDEGPFCAQMTFVESDPEQTLSIASNIAEVLPGTTLETTGTDPVTVQLCGNSEGVSNGSYQFSVSASDGACPVQGVQHYLYTIVIGAFPDAGLDTTILYCASDADLTLIDQLGGTPSDGGTWTGPDGEAFGSTFDPSMDVPGAYTYMLSGEAGCTGTATLTMDLLPPSDPLCMSVDVNDLEDRSYRITMDLSVRGRTNIIAERSGTVDLIVLGSDGRMVRTERLMMAAHTALPIDMPELASGVYVFQLVDQVGSLRASERIVVP